MKNTRLAFAFILIHLCAMTFAQSSKKITGRVVDEKGELLVGVNITLDLHPRTTDKIERINL